MYTEYVHELWMCRRRLTRCVRSAGATDGSECGHRCLSSEQRSSRAHMAFATDLPVPPSGAVPEPAAEPLRGPHAPLELVLHAILVLVYRFAILLLNGKEETILCIC